MLKQSSTIQVSSPYAFENITARQTVSKFLTAGMHESLFVLKQRVVNFAIAGINLHVIEHVGFFAIPRELIGFGVLAKLRDEAQEVLLVWS